MKTPGWKEVIGPMLDKMIIDTIGGKQNGDWSSGVLRKCRKDESISWYIGYRQFGVDFHNRCRTYVLGINSSNKALSEIDRLKKEEPYPFLSQYDHSNQQE